jgi:chromosome segregation ATPase
MTFLFSLYVFLSSNNKTNTTELTTVIVKLENIGSGIADLKAEMNTMRKDQREDHDKLIRLDESLESAWHRINSCEKKLCDKNKNTDI